MTDSGQPMIEHVVCPRCLGNPAVVCCALCQDAGTVPAALARAYYGIDVPPDGVNVDQAIALRSAHRAPQGERPKRERCAYIQYPADKGYWRCILARDHEGFHEQESGLPSPAPEVEKPTDDALLRKLDADGSTGLDLSPGDPTAKAAAEAIRSRDKLIGELRERLAQHEAGWLARERGEARDESKSVDWLNGWEHYDAEERADAAEDTVASLKDRLTQQVQENQRLEKGTVALRAEVEGLKAERATAMAVLAPNLPESGLRDACCQVKQVAITAVENCETLEALVASLRACLNTCEKHAKMHEESTPSDSCLFCAMDYRDLEIVRERELSFRSRAERAEQESDRRGEIIAQAARQQDDLKAKLAVVQEMVKDARRERDALRAEVAALKGGKA